MECNTGYEGETLGRGLKSYLRRTTLPSPSLQSYVLGIITDPLSFLVCFILFLFIYFFFSLFYFFLLLLLFFFVAVTTVKRNFLKYKMDSDGNEYGAILKKKKRKVKGKKE
uniref:Uncharacterized protein n=1 Tax=Trypanosoma vivax (strain Y486) TaxID=1055687 RepID=G0UAR3_TRYVY|nr:hypothetical protein, unlikely [Trypanosoma vivax Y486]